MYTIDFPSRDMLNPHPGSFCKVCAERRSHNAADRELIRRFAVTSSNYIRRGRYGFHLFRNASKSSGPSARVRSNSPFFWL